jgi:hypothetical protein
MLAVFDICLMDVDGLSVAIIIAAAVPLWTHRTAAAGRRNNCVIDASQLKLDASMRSHTACVYYVRVLPKLQITRFVFRLLLLSL